MIIDTVVRAKLNYLTRGRAVGELRGTPLAALPQARRAAPWPAVC